MENNFCNKHAILEHLSEMFTSMTLEDLRTTCETNKWALDRCIDALIESQKTRRGSLQTTFPAISFGKGAAENLENCADSKISDVVKTIQSGIRVFIIMRGAPGSGKSYLASKILEQSIPSSIKDYKTQDFIFSTDDFFYGPSGFYKFRPDKLDEAHLFNQERVRKKALDGWSPIIVDNTNIHIWEMMPYVKMAAENGYILKLVEPTTPWRLSPSKLAIKNKHGVPKDKIQRMLDNFEKTSEENLLKMLKSSYKDCTHRMRLHPPFPDIISNLKIPMNITQTQTEQKNSFESNKKLCDVRPATTSNWKTFEEETKLFWSDDQKHSFANKNLTSNKSLLDILKESIVPEVETKTKVELQTKTQNEDESQVLVPVANLKCHSLNCPNENKSFLMLRQMYPIREPASLWDLFLKCKGDLDWTVDILINEENGQNYDSLDCSTYFENELQCDCNQISDSGGVNVTSSLKTEDNSSKVTAKPQRERIRTSFKQHQTHQNSNEEVLSIKKKIENIFVFPNKPCSERRVRNIPRKHSTIDAETQTNYIDDDIDDTDSNEILVLTLGETLVEQLHSVFSEELSLFEKLSNNLSTNVFIPRSLAKQLFMVWVESAYNQMEEQNQESMRQDESFARLLKNPDFEDCKETPNNLDEILNSQIPWINLENFIEEELETKFSRDVQTDLATHLTEIKLCEQFPNIPKDTLLDIMKAHDNNYLKTMDLLQNSSSFEDSKELNELLLKTGKQQVTVGSGIDLSDKSKEIFGANFSKSAIDSQATRDELKLIALKEFEETRNIATHHCQLKAECFEKAKEAFQRGNGGVAAYYSQIAGYHKKKIDIYNQKAANCIVEVHRHTQCNPDLLDLHYLHVAEAVQCLDIFLDQHITGLRTSARVYKHVFLITGRGLHSVGGISSIKKRVKTRLKDRNLRWTEVNPGLLKVKLYSSSKHTTHC